MRVGAKLEPAVQGDRITEVLGEAAYESSVSWKDRRLEFNAEPQHALIHELQRYRSQRVRSADPEAEGVRITGRFSTTDPDLLLRTLPSVAPVNVQFGRDGEPLAETRLFFGRFMVRAVVMGHDMRRAVFKQNDRWMGNPDCRIWRTAVNACTTMSVCC